MSAITGVMPVAPTIFADNEELDLDGQRRVLDYLVDGKSDAVCILANYSEQFSLTDGEREQVLRTTMEHLDGRLPVCVTTSHFSSRIARERSLRAQEPRGGNGHAHAAVLRGHHEGGRRGRGGVLQARG
ncbi:dihydrodipicolinate synthase family protein [Pseudarthrobacter sp. Fe7]|nr:dihydrodipicolinate synthase family protein [Pseudarthrobacter sp. Fe7]